VPDVDTAVQVSATAAMTVLLPTRPSAPAPPPRRPSVSTHRTLLDDGTHRVVPAGPA
jgi:hypothetical protein